MAPRLALVLLALLLRTGAGPAAAGEILVIPGTGDSQALLGALARVFEEETPGVHVEVPPSVGTIGGIKRLLTGDVQLARTARPLSEQEKGRGLRQKVFAYSPIVFVANLERVCLDNLSAAQVVGIYAGRLTSWSQLGDCDKHKIYVANREEGDSSRRVLVERVPGFDDIKTFAGEILYSTPETQRIIEHYPYTFGYLPLPSAITTSLRFLRYEGVDATTAAVQQGDYGLVVPLGIAWKGELQGEAKAFVDFLFSPKGRRLIEENGAVPVARMPSSAGTN